MDLIKIAEEAFAGEKKEFPSFKSGDTITIEVYRTSTGQYKISPDNNPIDFLIACCLIPLGAVFSLALVYDLQRIQAVKKGQRGAVKEKQR